MSGHHFCPDRLPPARSFYEGEGFRLARPNSKGWAMAQGQPPCHKSESGKSFSINVNHGGFVCFGCGQKGSMVDFAMLSYRCDFKQAAQRLGAWDEAPSPEAVCRLAEQERACRRRQQAEEAEQRARHDRMIRLRDQLHGAAWHYYQTVERLAGLNQGVWPPVWGREQEPCWWAELPQGAAPEWDCEEEACWASLADTLNDWRDLEQAYCAAAGLEPPL
jgi:CHC2 zinc finger